MEKDSDFRRYEDQLRSFEEANKAREPEVKGELKTILVRKEEQSS